MFVGFLIEPKLMHTTTLLNRIIRLYECLKVENLFWKFSEVNNMLKKGLYGIYNELEFRITVDMDNNLKIMTDEKEKIDSTFEDTYQSGVYTKIVKPNELVCCVSVIPIGIIKGEKVQILQEKEDKYQVATGALLVGSNLDLPRIDRDSWVGWVSKSEVTIIEEITSINPEDL